MTILNVEFKTVFTVVDSSYDETTMLSDDFIMGVFSRLNLAEHYIKSNLPSNLKIIRISGLLDRDRIFFLDPVLSSPHKVEFDYVPPLSVKEIALAKLTDEEIEVLGLKRN